MFNNCFWYFSLYTLNHNCMKVFCKTIQRDNGVLILGQEYSLDEVCEKLYGPNFRFRRFPYLGVRDIYKL